jgi:hypothetical protein
MIKTYTELITFPTFEERFRYLKLNGTVCKETFGPDRYLNQLFYKRCPEWYSARREVIIRDMGYDLGVEGYPISGKVFVHHMNPISLDDIVEKSEFLLNPEYLITTSFNTHNAIHYGDENLLITAPIERTKNDTCPWRQ